MIDSWNRGTEQHTHTHTHTHIHYILTQTHTETRVHAPASNNQIKTSASSVPVCLPFCTVQAEIIKSRSSLSPSLSNEKLPVTKGLVWSCLFKMSPLLTRTRQLAFFLVNSPVQHNKNISHSITCSSCYDSIKSAWLLSLIFSIKWARLKHKIVQQCIYVFRKDE